MLEILSYEFMQNALLAGMLASVICGIIGVYVVLKRIVFISGGIAHFSFGGIGVGYYLGVNPLLAALGFSVLAALAIGASKDRMDLQEDTSIGILWAVGMAAGVIFVGLSKGYAVNLFSYLFGNILAVSRTDLALMAALGLGIVCTVAALYKEFLAIAFDEEYAETLGIPTRWLYVLLLCLIALSIVILIKVVGVILVIALLTIPASIARLYATTVRGMMVLATGAGMVLATTGLMASYYADLASGATIVIVSAMAFFSLSLMRRHQVQARRARAVRRHNQ